MDTTPRSVWAEAQFPYKQEIVAAIESGARVRKDDRGLRAGQLLGTYQIRLNIARDPSINGGLKPDENQLGRDLETIVKNLSVEGQTLIDVFYIRPNDHTLYYLFEYAETGVYVGCLRSKRLANAV